MNAHLQEVDGAFAEETNRLVAQRLLVVAVTLGTLLGVAWVIEHHAHPQRDWYYALLYGAELLTLAGATVLSRRRRWQRHSPALAGVAMVAMAGWIGLYHILVGGEGEVLAIALLYLITGAMVLLPWGWQGQLPLAVSAVLIYAVDVAVGINFATPPLITTLGLVAISALTVEGAHFLARHRLAVLQQAAELRAANTALAEAIRAKNQFLANVSHELRTPLNIIVGYTDLLLEGHFGGLPAEATDTLDRVAHNSRSLVYLISDLLDLSGIEADRLSVRLGTVDLPPVFAEMGHFMAARMGSSESVRFHAHAPDGLRVIADRERLEQILVNLLSNAAKFTTSGEIRLRAQPEADGMLAIEVCDTGPGISDAELLTLFEPFSQGAMGKEVGGVGIGLSLSLRLARAMGGTLTVNTEAGRGSTFVLRLPAATG